MDINWNSVPGPGVCNTKTHKIQKHTTYNTLDIDNNCTPCNIKTNNIVTKERFQKGKGKKVLV